MAPLILKGLRAQAYEHPGDTATLNALKNTAGLSVLVSKLNEWGLDKFLSVQFTGSYIRANADSLPDLHELLTTAVERLDMPSCPDLYIAASGELNAGTAGIRRPLIWLSSPAVESFKDEELLFVIAREAGHIKSEHLLYYQIAEFAPALVGGVVDAVTFGVGGDFVAVGLQAALMRWKRMSELTADRAGLLACQNVDIAMRTMMKLAGLPPKYYKSINTEDFLRQAREFQDMDSDTATKVAKWLATLWASHNWTVMRAQQLLLWVDSHGYEEVLKAPQRVAVKLPEGVVGYCNVCGRAKRGGEAFCPGCGTPQTAAGAASQ